MEYVIKNGLIVDGSGQKPFVGDILVRRDAIVEIGREIDCNRRKIIDATGLVVAPGIIDGHTHSEINVIRNRQQPHALYQGITTIVTGQCGLGFAPMREKLFSSAIQMNAGIFLTGKQPFSYWNTYEEMISDMKGSAVNVGANVSHNAIRQMVSGFEDRRLNKQELKDACNLLEQAMKEGALGLSVGLSYYPGGFSDTEELVALCKVVKKYDGVFCVHLRLDNGENELAPVQEIVKIIEETGVRLNMLHYKTGDWNNFKNLLKPFKELENRGNEIYYEYYPYLVGAGLVLALVPGWAQEGSARAILSRLKDNSLRVRLLKEIEERRKFFFVSNQTATISITKDLYSDLVGKTLEQISQERQLTYAETIIELLIENDLEIGFIGKQCCTDELEEKLYNDQFQLFMNERYTVGSDTIPEGTICHPRVFGTFPKVMRQMREREVPIEYIIKKFTSHPASIYNIKNRGMLKVGYKADICILDYEKVIDRATFDNARQSADGIVYVFVNGMLAYQEKTITGILGGHSIRRGE